MFEDNVDIALDYLAWLSRSTLELIESRHGAGPRAAGVLHDPDGVASAGTSEFGGSERSRTLIA